jgi:trans-aconitate 2-methyltransferase
VAQPHAAWGASVLDRLLLRGDEAVLDAGCGSGRVTAQLLERWPDVQVVAADVSPAMLDEARQTLAAFGNRVRFVETDLLQLPRALEPASVGGVVSTATFHWIPNHADLFAALRAVMQPGARLVSQFGGGDNLAELMRATDEVSQRPPYVSHLEKKALWRFYASPEETQARLEQAGFTNVEAWLEPSPQTFADAQALGDFGRAVVLRNHLAALPQDLHDAFVDDVTVEINARLGGWILDYVRLNADATAAAS